MNRRPFDHLAPTTRLVLAGLLALAFAAGCGDDALPGDEPGALGDELGALDAGAPAHATDDDDIDAITSASTCPVPPDHITTSMGPSGWQYSAQLWNRNDGLGGCTNPGQNVPYCPSGSGGVGCKSTFTLTSGFGPFTIGCGAPTEYGIWCDNQWIACPEAPTLSESNFAEANFNGYASTPWWQWPAAFRMSPSDPYTFRSHAMTTSFHASNGYHVQCNYYANYGFFYLTY